MATFGPDAVRVGRHSTCGGAGSEALRCSRDAPSPSPRETSPVMHGVVGGVGCCLLELVARFTCTVQRRASFSVAMRVEGLDHHLLRELGFVRSDDASFGVETGGMSWVTCRRIAGLRHA
jgi:hypothetical protein